MDSLLRPEVTGSSEPVTLSFQREMQKISGQAAMFLAGTVFTFGTGFFFKIYVARVLGSHLLGLYALGMTVVSIFGLFASLGLPNAAARFVAVYNSAGQADRLRSFLGSGSLLVGCVSALLGVLVIVGRDLIAEGLYHESALAGYLPLFGLMLPLGVLGFFFSQVLVGYQNVTRTTIINSFIGGSVSMVLAWVLFVLGLGLWGYVFAQVISGLVVLILMAWSVWRLIPAGVQRPRTYPALILEREVVCFSFSMIGINALEFLLGQSQRIVLGVYLEASQLGIFSVAAAISGFIPLLLQATNSIFAPVIAGLHARGEKEVLRRLFQTLTKWILGLTAPLVIVIVLFAPALMGIFGPEFRAGWLVVVIASIGQLVNCGVGSVGYLLIMSGHQNRLVRVQAYTGGLTLISSLLVVPLWGIVGAAAVGALTTVVSNLWYLGEVRRVLNFFPYNSSYLRLSGPLAAATVVAVLVQQAAIGTVYPQWSVMLVTLMLVYVVFVFGSLAFGLDDDDRMIVKTIWARVRGLAS